MCVGGRRLQGGAFIRDGGGGGVYWIGRDGELLTAVRGVGGAGAVQSCTYKRVAVPYGPSSSYIRGPQNYGTYRNNTKRTASISVLCFSLSTFQFWKDCNDTFFFFFTFRIHPTKRIMYKNIFCFYTDYIYFILAYTTIGLNTYCTKNASFLSLIIWLWKYIYTYI